MPDNLATLPVTVWTYLFRFETKVMSENHLKLIPTDPYFIPDPNAMNQARQLFDVLMQGSYKTTMEVFATVQFIDQGANWETLFCPNCQSVIDVEWWQQAMDRAFESGFLELGVNVPCCGFRTTLNDLRYVWPAGFARFRLAAINPPSDLSDEQLRELEHILGKSLRKIWAHY